MTVLIQQRLILDRTISFCSYIARIYRTIFYFTDVILFYIFNATEKSPERTTRKCRLVWTFGIRILKFLPIKFYITKTGLFKYTENFTTKKWKFSDKKSDIFHISTQNIDCGYSLEPPRRGGSNEYPQSMFF